MEIVEGLSEDFLAKFDMAKPAEVRPMTRMQLQYADELQLLREYRKYVGTRAGEPSLGALYQRHDRLMHTLALELLQRKPHVGGIEDCMSIIHIAAQVAYTRYNENKAGPKAALSTFVFKTVQYEMLTLSDRESFVHCPSQLRNMRTYFMGGYDHDPVKKANFEAQHGLETAEDQSKRRSELLALMPKFFVQDDDSMVPTGNAEGVVNRLQECFSDPRQFDQNGLALHLDMQRLKLKMTERQRTVYGCVWEQRLTMPETAQLMEISVGKVITADRGIKRLFAAYSAEIAAEARA